MLLNRYWTAASCLFCCLGERKVKRFKPIMTPRIDSRQTETDSAPDSYRGPISEALEETTTEYGKPTNKPRRFTETAITKELKDLRLGRLSLDDICEECKVESIGMVKSKRQYAQGISSVEKEREGRGSPRRSMRKLNDPFMAKEKGIKTGSGSVTPREQKQKLSLPKIP